MFQLLIIAIFREHIYTALLHNLSVVNEKIYIMPVCYEHQCIALYYSYINVNCNIGQLLESSASKHREMVKYLRV